VGGSWRYFQHSVRPINPIWGRTGEGSMTSSRKPDLFPPKADWDRTPFSSTSGKHISVWELDPAGA